MLTALVARPRRRLLGRGVAILIALAAVAPAIAPAGAAAITVHADDPQSRAERAIEAAETAMAEGRHREATTLFSLAYGVLPLSMRRGPIGENVVLHAAESAELAWLASDDVIDLGTAIDLLRRHVDEPGLDSRPDGAPRRVLARLEILRERVARPAEVGTSAPRLPARMVVPGVPRSTPPGLPLDSYRRRRRVGGARLGIGLAMSFGGAITSAYAVTWDDRRGIDGSHHFARTARPGLTTAGVGLGLAGPLLSGFGMRDVWLGVQESLPPARLSAARTTTGIALTSVGGATLVAAAGLAVAGLVRWGRLDPGSTTASDAANASVVLLGASLSTAFASLGVLAPGIAALATRVPARASVRVTPHAGGLSLSF